MRWGLRYQLLTPPLLLLLGVVAITAWTAVASAHRAWQQLETQVRSVARTFSEATYPLTENVLKWIGGYSGAKFHLIDSTGRPVTTFTEMITERPPGPIAVNWQSLELR